MALVSLNGRAVFSGEIVLRATGGSFADLKIDSKQPMTGRATLTAPGMTLVGTIDADHSAVYQDAASVRFVVGAGGLARVSTPKFYRNVPASVVLGDIMLASGETLSSTSDAPTLARVLPTWTRPDGTIADALRTLTELLGTTWRTLDDGSIYVGPLAFPTVTFVHQILTRSPLDQTVTIASETFKARPCTTLDGLAVREVRVSIAPGSIRTKLVGAAPFAESFAEAVRRNAGDLDALRWYACTVVNQAADGTLEVKPDDTANAPATGWTQVPLLGLPGVSVQVRRGCRVHLFFVDGNRSKPMAALSPDDASALELITFADGAASVARVGDEVDLGTLTATIPGAPPVPVTFTWVSPSGATVSSPSLTLTGRVATGAARVKA